MYSETKYVHPNDTQGSHNWKVFHNGTKSPTFAFPLYIGSWYFTQIKNHIWTSQKCIVRQSMCTQTAHRGPTTETFFTKKKCFGKMKFVCHTGAHILSHYTFLRGRDMVLCLCKISASYVEWKCKSRGGVKKYSIYTSFFLRFICKTKIAITPYLQKLSQKCKTPVFAGKSL